ncbi:MAG: MFS transporter [Actinomycetota bacterium]|nr:MFS transporter [Actinomycetota bacterium]
MSEVRVEKDKGVSARLVMWVVAAAIFVAVLQQTFVNVVVPDIRQDFGASQGQVGWVITGYLLIFAVGIPLYGRVADLYSLRYTFSLGLLGLAAGSVVCAFAPSLSLLVGGRILQAAGAAAIPALGFAAIAKLLPPGQRGAALGLLSSSVGVGAAVGPVAGGIIAGFAGWQSLFFVTLVLALVLAAGAWRVLPDAVSDRRTPGNFLEAMHHFDVPGGLLLAFAAGLALFGVTEGQVLGFTSPVTWGSFLLAIAAAVGFVWRIRSAPEPFVSPGLFRNPGFLAAVAVGFFMMFANIGTLVLTPFLLSEVNGLSAAGIGLVLAPGAAAVAILSPVAGRLSDRFGPRLLIRLGLAIILLSTLGLSTLGVGASTVAVTLGVLGLGLGFSFANSPTANAAAATLSPEESGVGLGIFQLVFFLGGGFGPAVAATFLAFRQEVGGAAINPLYPLGAAPFSDAFLLITLSAAIALVAALGVKQRVKGTSKETKDA